MHLLGGYDSTGNHKYFWVPEFFCGASLHYILIHAEIKFLVKGYNCNQCVLLWTFHSTPGFENKSWSPKNYSQNVLASCLCLRQNKIALRTWCGRSCTGLMRFVVSSCRQLSVFKHKLMRAWRDGASSLVDMLSFCSFLVETFPLQHYMLPILSLLAVGWGLCNILTVLNFADVIYMYTSWCQYS